MHSHCQGDRIAALARIAAEVKPSVENISVRRPYPVMEWVFKGLSFNAPDRGGQSITIDAALVEPNISALARTADTSRSVLWPVLRPFIFVQISSGV